MKKKKYGFSKRTLLFAPVAISLLFGIIVQAEENTIEPSLPSSTDIAQEQQEDMTVFVQSSTNSSLEDTTTETATAVSEIEITKQGINSVDEKTTVQVEASVSLEQENDNDIENTENVSDSKEQETSISEISSEPTQRIFSKQSAVSNGEAEKSTASLPREYSPVIVPITSVEKIEQNLVVNYTRPIKSNEIVQFAVWSEKSAQDDIIWYNADKTGAAYVDLRKHRDYGKYHVHTYSNANEKMVFLDKLELEVAEPVPSQKNIQTSVSTFDVIISNVPNYYTRIQVPTWTNSKNQDDIKWYEGVRQSDGSYKVSVDIKNHTYETGLYLVHSYGVLPNKKLEALAQTTQTVPQSQIKQTITNISLTGFDVVITGVPNYYTRVQVPTWTNYKNQDDIKWYDGIRQSDGSYKVSVDIKNHTYETGLYLVHSYGVLPNKKLVALAQTTHTVPQPQIKQTMIQTSLTGFDVVITGVPNYYTRVQVPTWTNSKNQDDIKWYEGIRQSDGSYKVSVDIKNHTYETGLYLVHSYGVLPNKKLVALAQTTHTVPKPQIKQTITQTSLTGFDVVITGVPNYYTRVQIPTWTNYKNQDDIKWYEGIRQSDGSYKVSVDIKNHTYETGLYLVHSYGVLPNKKLVALAQTSQLVPISEKPLGSVAIENVSSRYGTFTVRISELRSPIGIKMIQVPIWSDEKGQDDIVWYTGVKQDDGSFLVQYKPINHDYTSGLYHIHTYVKDMVNKLSNIATQTIRLEIEKPYQRNYTVAGKVLTILGENTPSMTVLRKLVASIKQLERVGYSMGFKLLDVNTNHGIIYNGDTKFYSASTIKGPFVASLAAKNPNSINKSKSTFLNIINYSSNDGYISIRRSYGDSSLKSWAKEAELNPNVFQQYYPYLTSNELFALWQRNYKYFTVDTRGKEVATWFERPNLSPIKTTLGGKYKTQTKAGWIGEPGYRAANDAGIVYTPQGNYILSIMSNADGKLGLLNPTISILDEIHRTSMIK